MPRFYIADCIPPVEGRDHGVLWNGWRCPYFDKAAADAIVTAWVKEFGESNRPRAWFDESTRLYWFDDPNSEPESFEARTVDGVEVWSIGAWGWCWEEAD